VQPRLLRGCLRLRRAQLAHYPETPDLGRIDPNSWEEDEYCKALIEFEDLAFPDVRPGNCQGVTR
jgi:hypothetical protein